ncbi:MAG: hypothetical protein AAFY70_12815, partial [Bacteroidota bacterium]
MDFTKSNFHFLWVVSIWLFFGCNPSAEVISTGDATSDQTELNASDPLAANIDHQLVVQWNSLMLEIDRYAYGMRPTSTARALAYIQLAAYETVVPGMTGYVSNDDRLRGFRIRNDEIPEEVDWQIALNTAYASVLDHFMLNVDGNAKAQIAVLENQMEATLSENVSEEVVEDSKRWGAYVAEQVIEYSETDDEAEEQILEPQPTSYEPPTGEGFWTYSAEPERALFPYWGDVRTFVISPNQTTTLDPIT